MKHTKMICALMAAVMGITSVPIMNLQTDSHVEIRAKAIGVDEITARADSLYNATWTAQADLKGYVNSKGNTLMNYKKGGEYHLPYGQPCASGGFIGYGISLDDFLKEANNPNSKFYTMRGGGQYGSMNSNYYSIDCSTLVSYCWGLPNRYTTSTWASLDVTNIGSCTSANVSDIEQGDALNKSESHIVLVSRVFSDGTYEITESGADMGEAEVKRTVMTAEELVNNYSTYTIYRYNKRDGVPSAPKIVKNHLPESSFDSYSINENTLHISGWAFDPDTIDQSVKVHVYAKNQAGEDIPLSGSVVANQSRPDVNDAYGCGENHGFEADIPLSIPEGTYTVQIALIDTEDEALAAWNEGGEFNYIKPRPQGSDIGDDFIGYLSFDQMQMIASSDKNVKMASRWDPNPYASSMTATKYMWHFIKDKDHYPDEPVYSIWSYNAYKNSAGQVKSPAMKWNSGSDAVVVSNDLDPNQLANFRWRIIKLNDEAYKIQPVSSDSLYLTLPKTDQNTAMKLADKNVGGEQIFYLYNIVKDGESPVIYSVTSKTLDNTSFKLTIDTNDNIGVKKVDVVTHSWRKDKEVTFHATQKDASHWECTIKNSSFNNDYGAFYSMIKVYDYKGNGATKIKSVKSYDSNNKLVSECENQYYVESKVGVYTLTMNPNGGTVDQKTKTLVYGGNYARNGDLPVPVLKGYSFNGWYTEKDGGTKVTDATTVTQKADHTIYAHWKINKVNVHYNGNGGTIASGGEYYLGSDSNVYKSADQKIVDNYWSYNQKYEKGLYNAGTFKLTRKGYTFKGWGTDQKGSKIYDQDDGTVSANDLYPDITTKSGTITVYAQWKANTYTVKFECNGGSASENSRVVTYDQTYGAKASLPTPKRDGYTFKGWFAESALKTRVTDATKVSTASNHSLYAGWEKIVQPTTEEPTKPTEPTQPTQPTEEISVLKGDVNGDDSVSVQDVIALQKWIHALPGASLTNADAADMNGDGVVDVFDLALLKREFHK